MNTTVTYPNIEHIIWRERDLRLLEHWREIYLNAADKHKCMILVLPFKVIYREVLGGMGRESIVYDNKEISNLRSGLNKNLDKNKDLYSDKNEQNVDEFFPIDGSFSPVIEHIKSTFHKTFGSISVGIHWRYNKGDWSGRCDVNWGVLHQGRPNPPECKFMDRINYEKLGAKLVALARKLGSIDNDSKKSIKYIYISSPPSELNVTKKIINQVNIYLQADRRWLSSKPTEQPKVKVLNVNSLKGILQKYYINCPWHFNYKQDVISLAEQAILSDAFEFRFFNMDSSWGKRIIDRRNVLGKGRSYSVIPILADSV